jgi:hypothetical protein
VTNFVTKSEVFNQKFQIFERNFERNFEHNFINFAQNDHKNTNKTNSTIATPMNISSNNSTSTISRIYDDELYKYLNMTSKISLLSKHSPKKCKFCSLTDIIFPLTANTINRSHNYNPTNGMKLLSPAFQQFIHNNVNFTGQQFTTFPFMFLPLHIPAPYIASNTTSLNRAFNVAMPLPLSSLTHVTTETKDLFTPSTNGIHTLPFAQLLSSFSMSQGLVNNMYNAIGGGNTLTGGFLGNNSNNINGSNNNNTASSGLIGNVRSQQPSLNPSQLQTLQRHTTPIIPKLSASHRLCGLTAQAQSTVQSLVSNHSSLHGSIFNPLVMSQSTMPTFAQDNTPQTEFKHHVVSEDGGLFITASTSGPVSVYSTSNSVNSHIYPILIGKIPCSYIIKTINLDTQLDVILISTPDTTFVYTLSSLQYQYSIPFGADIIKFYQKRKIFILASDYRVSLWYLQTPLCSFYTLTTDSLLQCLPSGHAGNLSFNFSPSTPLQPLQYNLSGDYIGLDKDKSQLAQSRDSERYSNHSMSFRDSEYGSSSSRQLYGSSIDKNYRSSINTQRHSRTRRIGMDNNTHVSLQTELFTQTQISPRTNLQEYLQYGLITTLEIAPDSDDNLALCNLLTGHSDGSVRLWRCVPFDLLQQLHIRSHGCGSNKSCNESNTIPHPDSGGGIGGASHSGDVTPTQYYYGNKKSGKKDNKNGVFFNENAKDKE